MKIMRYGQKGGNVKMLQQRLGKILNRSLSIDGNFGYSTEKAVKKFQKLYGLTIDGVVGLNTFGKINEVYEELFITNSKLLTFGKRRFVIFVDAGHGGIDDNGNYTTGAGKRAYNEGLELHERGHYYEGYENRIIAEAFIEECTKVGIQCIRLYHPFKDTSLNERVDIVVSWLRRGYFGYLHSFHSNAISKTNSLQKLLNTRGFMVFTTRKNNLSDVIAEKHMESVKEEVGDDWVYRSDMSDGDVDYEANLFILRKTDLEEFEDFASLLEEWGFHTSRVDCEFIVKPSTREKRVKAALKTGVWAKEYFETRVKIKS